MDIHGINQPTNSTVLSNYKKEKAIVLDSETHTSPPSLTCPLYIEGIEHSIGVLWRPDGVF